VIKHDQQGRAGLQFLGSLQHFLLLNYFVLQNKTLPPVIKVTFITKAFRKNESREDLEGKFATSQRYCTYFKCLSFQIDFTNVMLQKKIG